MAGTHYSEKLAGEICQLLAAGVLIGDMQQKLNISASNYGLWLKKYPGFREAVDKALAEANIGAAVVLRRAMAPFDETTITTKTRTETRLRKTKDGEQVPYNWVSTTQLNSTTKHAGDWRAALEFLKRRDPEHWADKMLVVVEPEHVALLDNADISPAMLWRLTLIIVQGLVANNLNVKQTLNSIAGEIGGGQLMIDAEALSGDD